MNARSICNKTDSIISLCTDSNIDVAIVTETWLTDKHTHTINPLSSPPTHFVHVVLVILEPVVYTPVVCSDSTRRLER